MYTMKAGIMVILASVVLVTACDKKNDEVVKPVTGDNFPQLVILADEGDGGLEDEDKFSFKITLADRRDPDGEEPGGKIVPLDRDVRVAFSIVSWDGFTNLGDYIRGAEAFFEIDDCTTSLDEGIDLGLEFDIASGRGVVTFPKGVEEIEIEFETDADLFDDNVFNENRRGLEIQLESVDGAYPLLDVNRTAVFDYAVQDDEGVYGKWELDPADAVQFARFKELFGLVSDDISALDADDVEEVNIEFEYGEVKIIVVLKETEMVDDCGSPSLENKVIEIETEIEDISDDSLDGNVEFAETIETGSGRFADFVYTGNFSITSNQLTITLEGDFDDNTTGAITLQLNK